MARHDQGLFYVDRLGNRHDLNVDGWAKGLSRADRAVLGALSVYVGNEVLDASAEDTRRQYADPADEPDPRRLHIVIDPLDPESTAVVAETVRRWQEAHPTLAVAG